MQWGIDDCLTDLFGDDAHEKISWVKKSHNDTLKWVLTLSNKERWDLMRATAEGQGHVRVQDSQPGDGAIGEFRISRSSMLQLPTPWFAQKGIDCHWYVRLPKRICVVDYVGEIEVYRCQRLQ